MDNLNALSAHAATTIDALTTDPGVEPRVLSRPYWWCLTVLAHPDLTRVGAQYLWDSSPGREIHLSRLSPHFRVRQPEISLPLEDTRISRSPIRIRSTPSGLEIQADTGRVLFELDGRPVTGVEHISIQALSHGVILTLGRHVCLMLNIAPKPGNEVPVPGLLGVSGSIRSLWQELARVAPLDMPVLLTGESGVGKELAAHAIHRLSPRAQRNFLAVNVAAMTATTAAAELFGHSRGAFTGAEARRGGYFGEAEGGTLFLDEIGETPTEVQPMLLRAIESGEIQPMGLSPRASDVRIISATDAHLETLVATGRFRPALLHRLRATHIALPPLRARREDIPMLLIHFLKEALPRFSAVSRIASSNTGTTSWLGIDLMLSLMRYSWPGNVRELRNVAYEIALASHSLASAVLPTWLQERIDPHAAPQALFRAIDPGRELSRLSQTFPQEAAATALRPADISVDLLRGTLEAKDWQIGATAQALGISRNSLYALMRESGIVHAAGLTSGEILAAAAVENSREPSRLAARLKVSERGLLLRLRTLGLTL